MTKLILTMCDLLEKGENVIMATVARTPGQALLAGAKMVVRADGICHGTIGGGLLEKEALTIVAEMFVSGAPGVRILEFAGEAVTSMQTLCGKGVTVVVEYIAATPACVGMYRRLLDALQCRVKCCLITSVYDCASKRRSVKTALICEDGSTLGELPCADRMLPALLEAARSVSSPSLREEIGIIGSLRKRDALFRELMDTGIGVDDLLRIYCPIGINILAKTPAEIATSIVAELILVRSRRIAAQNGRANRIAEIENVPVKASAVETGGRKFIRAGRFPDAHMGE